MGFSVPDIIIESIIRDGIEDLKANPDVIDDVFSELTRPYASRKYGASELQKIKDLITGANNTEIAVVHSFHEAAAKSPCFSIQLGMDAEPERQQYLDDFTEDQQIDITDSAKLDALKKVINLTPISYEANTGKILVDDSVNLSEVYKGYLYVDGDSTEHEIIGGINNTPGDKSFYIGKNVTVNIVDPGEVKSPLTVEQFELRGTAQQTDILIGVHSKEALLTKYMYILLKYFLKSRKKDMILRCFDNPVLKGSDFTRDLQYQGDMVFTRFLTLSGRTEDVWRSDQVTLIDSVEIDATAVDDC